MDKKLKEAYQQEIARQLKVWEAEITRLKAGANVLKADAQIEYQKRLLEFQKLYREAYGRYEELERASENRWDQIKVSLDAATDKVRKILEEFTSPVA